MLNSDSTLSDSLQSLDRSSLLQVAEALEAIKARRDTNKLAEYRPYEKQKEFHRAGKSARERLLMAGNQLGKTYSGSAEMAMHLTGRYPDWWDGRRWDRPVRAWAASVTSEVTRDGVQRLLVGDPLRRDDWGKGLLPGDTFTPDDTKVRQGVANALASVSVRHVSGGDSSLGFKSYDQGRQKFQGETLDLVWLDEEPPADVYFEALTRTNATKGSLYLTFTPLMGMSDVVMRFLEDE